MLRDAPVMIPRTMVTKSKAERLGQLEEGTAGAAAALPAPHAALGSRAAEVVGRLASAARAVESAAEAGAEGSGGGTSAGRLAPGVERSRVERAVAEALELVEDLHFRLIKVKVHDVAPEELEIPGRLEEAVALAERLEEMLQRSPPGAGRPDATGPGGGVEGDAP